MSRRKVRRAEVHEHTWQWTADPIETLKFLTDECFDYSANILWRDGRWLILTEDHAAIKEDVVGYVLTDGSGIWWFETPGEFNSKLDGSLQEDPLVSDDENQVGTGLENQED